MMSKLINLILVIKTISNSPEINSCSITSVGEIIDLASKIHEGFLIFLDISLQLIFEYSSHSVKPLLHLPFRRRDNIISEHHSPQKHLDHKMND